MKCPMSSKIVQDRLSSPPAMHGPWQTLQPLSKDRQHFDRLRGQIISRALKHMLFWV